MKKFQLIAITTFFALILTLSLISKTQAAGASLFLTPAGGVKYVGGVFTASVKVDTGGQAANAFEATLHFPTDKLLVTETSTGGSVCAFFVKHPVHSNNDGTIHFSCGLPNPGYNGSSGSLINVSFRAKSAGKALVTMVGGKVLANDGAGTEIPTAARGATYDIQPPPAEGPVVISPTHPDQNAWYQNKSPKLQWTKDNGMTAFSYEFNQLLETIPDQVQETEGTEVSFEDKADGVWYFSLRGKNKNGWSSTTHYRIGIDSLAPENLTVTLDPSGEEEIDRRPLISFAATDATSGVDYYQIRLDNEEWLTATSPYQPETIVSGERAISVKAVDKAGNEVQTSLKVKIKKISQPIIQSPKDGTIIELAKDIKISGTAQPGTKVILYLDGKKVSEEIGVSEDGGVFNFDYKELLWPGKHHLWAVAIKDGILSQPSNKVEIDIDETAVTMGGLTIPGAAIALGILALISFLIFLLIILLTFFQRRLKSWRARFDRRNEEIEEAVTENLTALERNIETEIEKTYEGGTISPECLKSEHELERKIKSDIDQAKEGIENELKDPSKNKPTS
jgi:hypothetical protein